MMEFLFEKVLLAYRGGERVTLDVGERDGYVVIGLNDGDNAQACLLEPPEASQVVIALRAAIARAKVKRES